MAIDSLYCRTLIKVSCCWRLTGLVRADSIHALLDCQSSLFFLFSYCIRGCQKVKTAELFAWNVTRHASWHVFVPDHVVKSNDWFLYLYFSEQLVKLDCLWRVFVELLVHVELSYQVWTSKELLTSVGDHYHYDCAVKNVCLIRHSLIVWRFDLY